MSEQEIRSLIGQLRDFRLRSRAADRLVVLGREAVPHLIEALDREGQEGARWAILKCLGESRSPEAAQVLVRWLGDRNYHSVAHEALVRMAGRDLGPLPEEWLRWARRAAGGADAAPAADAADRDAAANRQLIEQAVEGTAATWREDEPDRFRVSVPLSGARSREVTVVFGSTDHEGCEIALVYCNCGEASADDYEAALRRNLRMPYGAIGLRDIGGRPCFVMFNTILRHGLSPVELRKSVFTIGERAAQIPGRIRD
ncbi:MAG: HEAT repeat domain-containing protein [Candidatus Brocadiaceae bacterium]|nr:HEAT repeat domain-containing protein [Candidatus Brocadiaceae bacterium]